MREDAIPHIIINVGRQGRFIGATADRPVHATIHYLLNPERDEEWMIGPEDATSVTLPGKEGGR